jgi:hypothetical protein
VPVVTEEADGARLPITTVAVHHDPAADRARKSLDARAPETAHRGATDRAGEEPGVRGGVSGPRQTPRHRRQGRGVPRGRACARVEGSAAWFFRRQREGELRSGRLGLQDRPRLAFYGT